jgi:hypothetical protein
MILMIRIIMLKNIKKNIKKNKYTELEIISEKIIPNFNRLTEYMIDNSILRTSNKAEQEYSKSKLYEIKGKYKIIE